MKQWTILTVTFMLLCAISCGTRGARSEKSFDEIRKLCQGRTTTEVERLLGSPDSRQSMPFYGESWTWWNYTYLDGSDVAPEERGRVVHLKILFDPDAPSEQGAAPANLTLRASNPLAVSYMIPQLKSL